MKCSLQRLLFFLHQALLLIPVSYTHLAEPDHSGGFLKFMKDYPNARPYASNAGVGIMLKQYFKSYDFQRVKTGDTLSTGRYTLTFVEMPMIHWPDNMLTYVCLLYTSRCV